MLFMTMPTIADTIAPDTPPPDQRANKGAAECL